MAEETGKYKDKIVTKLYTICTFYHRNTILICTLHLSTETIQARLILGRSLFPSRDGFLKRAWIQWTPRKCSTSLMLISTIMASCFTLSNISKNINDMYHLFIKHCARTRYVSDNATHCASISLIWKLRNVPMSLQFDSIVSIFESISKHVCTMDPHLVYK